MSVAKERHFRSYYYFDETYLSMQILALCFHKYILNSSVSLHVTGLDRSVSSLLDKGERSVTSIIQTENNIHKRQI